MVKNIKTRRKYKSQRGSGGPRRQLGTLKNQRAQLKYQQYQAKKRRDWETKKYRQIVFKRAALLDKKKTKFPKTDAELYRILKLLFPELIEQGTKMPTLDQIKTTINYLIKHNAIITNEGTINIQKGGVIALALAPAMGMVAAACMGILGLAGAGWRAMVPHENHLVGGPLAYRGNVYSKQQGKISVINTPSESIISKYGPDAALSLATGINLLKIAKNNNLNNNNLNNNNSNNNNSNNNENSNNNNNNNGNERVKSVVEYGMFQPGWRATQWEPVVPHNAPNRPVEERNLNNPAEGRELVPPGFFTGPAERGVVEYGMFQPGYQPQQYVPPAARTPQNANEVNLNEMPPLESDTTEEANNIYRNMPPLENATTGQIIPTPVPTAAPTARAPPVTTLGRPGPRRTQRTNRPGSNTGAYGTAAITAAALGATARIGKRRNNNSNNNSE